MNGLKHPATAIAALALVVALGGTTYAATSLPRNSVGTKQLKNSAVASSKIKNGAVTAGKINTNGLTVPNAHHATSATNATNAGNARTLGGLASSAFLQEGNGLVVFSRQQGWVMQQGDSGSVDTYSNAQVLDTTSGSSDYYFPLDSLNGLGAQQYYLYTVVICYDVSSSQITDTRIDRINNNNTQTVLVNDSTTRNVAYPGVDCYTEVVNDNVRIQNDTDTYYVDLTTTGTTTRIFHVTAGYEPFSS
jgi:hypothetical protein